MTLNHIMRLRAVTQDSPDAGGAVPAQDLPVHSSVLRAISVIRERYAEPITLARLAAEVYVSPFHFSRLFTKATGMTPGRFITAVRLFEAKRLLLTTSRSITDIVCDVGYASVGTFTSRFTRAVGLSPSQYRDPAVRSLLLAVSPGLTRLPPVPALAAMAAPCGGPGNGAVTARISLPPGVPSARVLIGLFGEPVPQCRPVAYGGLASARTGDHVTVHGVPPGRWSVLTVAEHAGAVSIGTRPVPVTVTQDGHAIVTTALRAPRPTDAPVAVTLACLPARSPRENVAA